MYYIQYISFTHEKIENSLLIPEIKYKVTDTHNTHSSITVEFSIPRITV